MHSPKLIAFILHDAELGGHIDLGQVKRLALERRYIPIHLKLSADHIDPIRIACRLAGIITHSLDTEWTATGSNRDGREDFGPHSGTLNEHALDSLRRTQTFDCLRICNRTTLVILCVLQRCLRITFSLPSSASLGFC